MESSIHRKTHQTGINLKIIIGIIIAAVFLIVGAGAYLVYDVLTYDKVYAGVYINDIHAGSMLGNELTELLERKYQEKIDNSYLILTADGIEEKIPFTEFGVKYDITEAVNRAFSVGRTGSLFSKIIEISRLEKDKEVIHMPLMYDKARIKEVVDSFVARTNSEVKEHKAYVQENMLVLESGQTGLKVKEDELFESIENIIQNIEPENILEVPLIKSVPDPLDAEEIYNSIYVEMIEPSVEMVDGEIKVVQGVNGVSVDKDELLAAVNEINSGEKREIRIPLIFTEPEKIVEDVESRIFCDILYTASTEFDTSTTNNANRAENIRLVTEKINGLVLMPGDVFSFNDVVGPRTPERGFKSAHVYYDGKIVDETGGGICQASSTLYLAVLHADLEVVERVNHMFTVSYVPLGSDATVSWGWPDFKFRNSTNWPIRIDAHVTEDNKVVYTLVGTNENPGKTVEIYSPVINTYYYQTEYIDDPSLPAGQEIIEKYGITGYLVDTYKVVYQDGVKVSEKKIHSSYYQPDKQIVRRGTAVVEQTASEPEDSEDVNVDETVNSEQDVD